MSDPAELLALLRIAVAHEQAGRMAEAEAAYRDILGRNPDHVPTLHHFGLLAAARGRPDVAATLIGRAAELAPHDPAACNNHGNMLAAAGQLDAAFASHLRTVALHPGYQNAYLSLSNALERRGALSAAIATCQRALALDPGYWQAKSNLATLLHDVGCLPEAIAIYRAVLIECNDPAVHVNLAHSLLASGDFQEGWSHYEHRTSLPMHDGQRFRDAAPRWRGEPAAGMTLMVHAEQGLGDTIQFCRYLVLAAARGCRVVFEVQPVLRRLTAGLAGVDQIVVQGQALPPFDLHCPLMSLPGILGTRVETIPGNVPYLVADIADTAVWAARMPHQSGLRVGLAWAGNPQLSADGRRSIPAELLAPLLDCSGIAFFSLQKGHQAPAGVVDLMNDVSDFADTAALIANLDLVISVDTAVAHLAGAMGKPVWLLNRHDSDWRWLRDRDDSPWYPTLRQFRQASPGDWDGVIARVEAELRRMGAPSSSHWPNGAGCTI